MATVVVLSNKMTLLIPHSNNVLFMFLSMNAATPITNNSHLNE